MTDDHLTPAQKGMLTEHLIDEVVRELGNYDGNPDSCSSAKLAEFVGVSDGATHPVVRAAIAEALRRGMAPICADSRGYFIARDESYVSSYSAELEQRAAAIQARAHNVRRAWHVRSGNTAMIAKPEAPHWVPDPEEEP